jgi:2-oxoglutarate ferredoxin oxidoreductase subunit alpha
LIFDFMSETTLAVPSSGGTPKVSKISEAVIRIAGNSQDGIQAIGGFLARLAGRSCQRHSPRSTGSSPSSTPR